MIVGSIKESAPEKRISITPETTKNLKGLGLNIYLEKGYGESLGYLDEEYKEKGAEILDSKKEILSKSDLICKVNIPIDEDLNTIKENSNLIVSSIDLKDKKKLSKIKINIFSLNLLPRITRAQSMDVLSSQANLAGYRAVI